MNDHKEKISRDLLKGNEVRENAKNSADNLFAIRM